MTGARITYTLDDAAFQAAVAKLGGGLSTGVMRAIGDALVKETQLRFERGVDPFGVAWKPLNPAYAAIKRGPGILRQGRYLQRFITRETQGNTITVGSNRIYAAVHQFGATIKPKNGKALAFRLGKAGPRGGKGSGLVFARSVTIPARPYLGFGPADRRAVMETLEGFVTRAFGA